MMRLKGKLLLMMLCAIYSFLSQTGPAGVGNSSNNVLWIKANEGTSSTTDGNPISSWLDQSGNGVHLTQTTSNQQPVYRAAFMNGQPAIEFDNVSSAGQNDFMTSPDNSILDNTDGYSFFSVTNMKALSGDAQTILSKRVNVGNEHAFMFFFFTGGRLHVDLNNTDNRFNTGVATPASTNKIYDIFYDGTLSSSARASVYDGENLLITATESNASIPDKASPLILGSTHIGDNRAFNGYMSEIILFRNKVNDAQRIIINNYLSAKYNIPLSVRDVYAGDDPANGNYDLDVAGIGQDATGANNASFSPFASKGLGITSVSGLDNNDYILVGHASSSNTAITTDVAGVSGTQPSRWQRIWYIDVTNTGSANVVDVRFNIQAAGVPATVLSSFSNYVLLFRSSTSGSWTEVASATGISATEILFSGFSLVSDGYYTVGTKNFHASPLPVDLVDFQVKKFKEERFVRIKWQTATEKDNDYFLVERSRDAIEWETLEKVKGQGSSQTVINYQFDDYTAQNGINYYRLIQVDFDGKTTVSEIRSVQIMFDVAQLMLFPNPASEYVTIISPNKELTFYDLSGKSIQGNRTFFEIGSNMYYLDISNLPKGIYVISDGQNQEKLIVE